MGKYFVTALLEFSIIFIGAQLHAQENCSPLFVSAPAEVGVVTKKLFSMPSYKTFGGEKISGLSVGYETYGTMNADGTNVIFIAHHYSGNSHAAGKYSDTDKAPGYWDAIIGPGKAIDTNKYFVVSADTLVNLFPFDPHVHTTGPASINPATGKAYGASFPAVTSQDFVRVHYALLKSLGVKSLQAVMGASGGSMQAFNWAVQYPRFVKRVIAVITPGLSVVGTSAQLKLRSWADPILQDPACQNGDYTNQPPLGISVSLAQTSYDTSVNVDAQNNWAMKTFGVPWEQVTAQQKMNVEAPKLATIDANSIVYTIGAYDNFNLESQASRIKAQVMMIPASSDQLFPPSMAAHSRDILIANGVRVEPIHPLQGTGGHLDGILQISQAIPDITQFLAQP